MPGSYCWQWRYAATALLLRGRELVVEHLDLVAAAASALAAVYAVSLAIMEGRNAWAATICTRSSSAARPSSRPSGSPSRSLLLAVGLTRQVKELRYGGFLLLGLALAKLFLFDLSQLSSLSRAASFLAVGLALLAGGFLVQRFTTAART